jgi:hypothetical protein
MMENCARFEAQETEPPQAGEEISFVMASTLSAYVTNEQTPHLGIPRVVRLSHDHALPLLCLLFLL